MTRIERQSELIVEGSAAQPIARQGPTGKAKSDS
jgi:hypothetical protein